jgi:hypothetical protein
METRSLTASFRWQDEARKGTALRLQFPTGMGCENASMIGLKLRAARPTIC